MVPLHRLQQRAEDLPLSLPPRDLADQIEKLRSSGRLHGCSEDSRQGIHACLLEFRVPDHGEFPRQSRLQREGARYPGKEAVDRPHGEDSSLQGKFPEKLPTARLIQVRDFCPLAQVLDVGVLPECLEFLGIKHRMS